MRKIKYLILILATFMATFSGFGIASASDLSTHSDYIFASAGQADACNGLDQVSGSSGTCGTGQSKISSILSAIVNIISYIAGAIAVIMIIIAGIRFTTSGGDSNGVASARTALIYAMVGIAVVALAQLFVHFALSTSNV